MLGTEHILITVQLQPHVDEAAASLCANPRGAVVVWLEDHGFTVRCNVEMEEEMEGRAIARKLMLYCCRSQFRIDRYRGRFPRG
jgi:hypothetical protein